MLLSRKSPSHSFSFEIYFFQRLIRLQHSLDRIMKYVIPLTLLPRDSLTLPVMFVSLM